MLRIASEEKRDGASAALKGQRGGYHYVIVHSTKADQDAGQDQVIRYQSMGYVIDPSYKSGVTGKFRMMRPMADVNADREANINRYKASLYGKVAHGLKPDGVGSLGTAIKETVEFDALDMQEELALQRLSQEADR